MNKQILRLAVPFIISNITVPLVSSVDTALMGTYGSTAHLGAIGLGSAIFNFLYWNFAFIRMSTVGLTAQELGKKNQTEVSMLLGRALLVSILGALLLLIFQDPIARLALKITKGDADVESYTLLYYRIRIWAAPATISLSALTGWFIGMQNAKTPMLIAIVVNVINIALSFILVKYTSLLTEGVALGTVIGQYTGLMVALIVLFRKYSESLKLIDFHKLIRFIGFARFFKVNSDVFIRTFAVIAVLTYYNIASAEKGKVLLGVNVIFLQLIYAFSFFYDGFANAAEALVGRYVGMKDKINLKILVKYLFLWGFGIAAVFTCVYGFAWKPIIHFFSKDPLILQAAGNYIIWILAIPLISIITFVWDGVFLGATATAEQRNATLIAALLFFIIYKFFDPIIGNHALLLAQLVFFGMRGLLQSFYYKSAILNKVKD